MNNMAAEAEHAVQQERELFSLSNRPFQSAKENGRAMCCKCFERDGSISFFAEGSGLRQHFRTMHRNVAVDDSVLGQCKARFQEFHGDETAEVINQLSNLRVQAVPYYYIQENAFCYVRSRFTRFRLSITFSFLFNSHHQAMWSLV